MKIKRFVAFIIDIIMVATLAIIVNVILSCLSVRVISPMIGLFAWAIIICKDSFDGMSIGKRLLGIQVVDSNKDRIASPIKCIIRNLFYFLSFIDLLVMFFHPKGMRLGDYVAHTEVNLRDRTLQKVKFYKIILAIGYVLIGLIIMEIVFYFRASSLGLLGYLYQ